MNSHFSLGLKNPCLEIIFTLQYQWLRKLGYYFWFGQHVTKKDPLIKRCSLLLNGYDLFENRHIDFCRWIMPYEHHANTLDPYCGINVVPFSFFPDQSRPSGSLNMSRIDQVVLNLITTNEISSTQMGIVEVYTRYYNILQVSDGIAMLTF